MATLAAPSRRSLAAAEDQRVFLHGVSWDEYEAILAIRGERSVPRITYLEGDLELMSPSVHHERYKTATGRLLEAYALARGLSLNGYGSWTVKKKRVKRGAEADECYVLGAHEPERPDLAIEIEWTPGGIDKLEVWRKLGVREVWLWREGRLEAHALRGDRHERIAASELFPELDLVSVARFAMRVDQTRAVREFLATLGDEPAHARRARRKR